MVRAVTPGPGWLTALLGEARIPVHTTEMKGVGWWRTMGHLIREVRRYDIDVVHTHLTRSAYIGHALGLVTGVPIVTSVHIANNDQIYARLARRRNRLIAVSNFVAGMLHGKGVSKEYIETIYNGTDFADLDCHGEPGQVRDEFGIPANREIVGLVGKVCRDKGQLELVQAMGVIKARHPNAHLMFVGKVDEPYGHQVEQVIRQEGLQDRVTFTGVRDDIPRLLDSFTLSTLPSYMETFGLAAVEAMARGKAVVATRVGALPEVVRDRQTGLLVDLRPESIAEAVSYLLSNNSVREDMGRSGRRLVEQKFTLEHMVNRVEHLFSEVASVPQPQLVPDPVLHGSGGL
jgi:glycosyltransferase involved in cell wall biosynthesis